MFFSIIASISVFAPIIVRACDNNAHPNGDPYRAEGDCNSYYTCDNGIENLHSCESEQVFNPLYRLCDWPENVPECSCFPNEQPSVNTNDCSTYLQCGEVVPCLDNKVFDTRYNYCSSEPDVPNCGTVVNGEWSEWSEYGECSVECGGGVQIRTRDCNNPAPENGGLDCVGNSTETQECNTCACVTVTTTVTVTETVEYDPHPNCYTVDFNGFNQGQVPEDGYEGFRWQKWGSVGLYYYSSLNALLVPYDHLLERSNGEEFKMKSITYLQNVYINDEATFKGWNSDVQNYEFGNEKIEVITTYNGNGNFRTINFENYDRIKHFVTDAKGNYVLLQSFEYCL